MRLSFILFKKYRCGTVLAQYISDNTDVKITVVSSGGSTANIDDPDHKHEVDDKDDQFSNVHNDLPIW